MRVSIYAGLLAIVSGICVSHVSALASSESAEASQDIQSLVGKTLHFSPPLVIPFSRNGHFLEKVSAEQPNLWSMSSGYQDILGRLSDIGDFGGIAHHGMVSVISDFLNLTGDEAFGRLENSCQIQVDGAGAAPDTDKVISEVKVWRGQYGILSADTVVGSGKANLHASAQFWIQEGSGDGAPRSYEAVYMLCNKTVKNISFKNLKTITADEVIDHLGGSRRVHIDSKFSGDVGLPSSDDRLTVQK